MQIPGANLIIGRGNPFTLLVAQSQFGNATGNLFWDDGDSIGSFAHLHLIINTFVVLDSMETKTYNYFEFTLTGGVIELVRISRRRRHTLARLVERTLDRCARDQLQRLADASGHHQSARRRQARDRRDDQWQSVDELPLQYPRSSRSNDYSSVRHLFSVSPSPQILLLYGLDVDMLAQAKQTVSWTTQND